MARRWFLGALLALEALYLVGIMAVAVPFGMAMERFEDEQRAPLAYVALYALLAVSVAVLVVAVVANMGGWVERPDRAAAARTVVGTAALLNFGASLAAIAMAFSAEALFWSLAAGYAFATGLGCMRGRAETIAT